MKLVFKLTPDQALSANAAVEEVNRIDTILNRKGLRILSYGCKGGFFGLSTLMIKTVYLDDGKPSDEGGFIIYEGSRDQFLKGFIGASEIVLKIIGCDISAKKALVLSESTVSDLDWWETPREKQEKLAESLRQFFPQL